MDCSLRSGRWVGVLSVVQLAGLIVPFAMLHPLAIGAFLPAAAGAAGQIQAATFLLLANCGLGIAIAIALWPVIQKHSSAMATLLVAIGAIMFTLQAVDNGHIMSMVSLSGRYVDAGGPSEPYQTLAVVAGSARKWVHYWELFAIDAWIFTLHLILFRFALVPRALAGFGLLTVAVHLSSITLPMLLGYPGVMALGAVMALGHLALAGWLIAKGFQDRLPTRSPQPEFA
jgi:hypothetical protein